MIPISENNSSTEQARIKTISRQRFKTMFSTAGFILVLSLGFFTVMGLLGSYSVDFCLSTLRQEAQNTKNNINRHISTFKNDMDVLACLIDQEDNLSSIEVHKILEAYEKKDIISKLGILLPDNRVMMPDGTCTLSINTVSFDELAEKGPFFSDAVQDPLEPGNWIVYYSIPIQDASHAEGILLGIIELDHISRYFEVYLFDGNSSLSIVDSKNMDLILNTLHGRTENTNVQKGRQIKNGYNEQQLIRDFSEGQKGMTAYFSPDLQEYLYTAYEPVGINQWFLLLSVPESTVLEGTQYIKTVLLWLCIFEGIISLIYFFLILFYSQREMKSKEAEIRHIYYMYNIQQTLFDAYRQPENILISLEMVARATTARFTLLAAIADNEVCRVFTWQEKPDEENSQKRMKQIAQVLAEDMMLRHYGYTVSAKGVSARAGNKPADKITELLDTFRVSTLMAIPIEGQEHHLIGVLAAIDMAHPCDTTDLLTCVAFSFSMALYNIQAYETIEKMGTTDSLTNLRNRNSYEQKISQYEANPPARLTCIYADANGLHELNNSQGHTAGDRMLQFVAHVLADAFRDGYVYRIGGDEFLAFTDLDEASAAELAAEAKKKAQESGYHVSIGTASGDSTMSPSSIVKTAEQRMYEDKRLYYIGANDRRQMR